MTLTKPKSARVPHNHHKRSAGHHRQSQHYVKAYWPYLPVFAVLSLGVIVNNWLTTVHHSVLGYSTGISAQVLLAETNDQRNSKHEPALQLSSELTAAAQAKANDMAARGYWSHVTPDGTQPWSFIDASGYKYEAAGENLAYGFGSSSQVMTAWMHSPEHRANILDAVYQDVGFATANAPNYQGTGPQTIVVAMYGEPLGMINASTNSTTSTPVVLGTQTVAVSRVSLISTATWLPVVLAAICGGALTLFFVRHAYAWHKVLVRGEQLFLAHPFFDVFLIAAAVLALLLSPIAGTIL
ncbi:MAG TPA: CAP domain-containing protein [Candidatus Saccharimonadales bacterium]|nr:CAP domain-containing protein [Candidatus Saccharimonadales bacterium]